jgi:AraC-like DNA-binding protein
MITNYRTTRRYFGKRLAKQIKKKILAKYPTMKALAEELGVNPGTLRAVVNGTAYSKRMARMIEEAVGEKLFPYTEE